MPRWDRIGCEDNRNKGGDVRERIAYLFMVTVLIMLLALTFAVLGKGEYKAPPPEEQAPVEGATPQ